MLPPVPPLAPLLNRHPPPPAEMVLHRRRQPSQLLVL
jgi:hypothetical protein